MLVFGHRGAEGEAPESTISGFQHAIAIGLQAVEFDVQLTADQHPVVIHDSTVDRTTNGSGAVASFTLAEIQALDARGPFADWPTPCRIPTLEEVLTTVQGLAALLVEIKRDTPARLEVVVPATTALISRYGLAPKVIISSFDPCALDIAQRIAPEIPRMMNGAWREGGLHARAIAAGCQWVDFDYNLAGQDHVDWARSHGMSIVGWPCNSEDDLRALLAFDVDAVGSDHPRLIKELVESPGAQ